jgi:hypothetical protein
LWKRAILQVLLCYKEAAHACTPAEVEIKVFLLFYFLVLCTVNKQINSTLGAGWLVFTIFIIMKWTSGHNQSTDYHIRKRCTVMITS